MSSPSRNHASGLSVSTATSRAAIVLVALLVCAWLLVQYRDAHLAAGAQRTALDPYSTPADIRSGIGDASASDVLNPDPYEARFYQSVLEVRAGHPKAAVSVLESVVADQPDYVEAWFILSRLTQRTDPRRSALASARARALDPLGTRPRR